MTNQNKTASKILLVEGPNDQHVIWSLCNTNLL